MASGAGLTWAQSTVGRFFEVLLHALGTKFYAFAYLRTSSRRQCAVGAIRVVLFSPVDEPRRAARRRGKIQVSWGGKPGVFCRIPGHSFLRDATFRLPRFHF